ncbi:MAG: helix-turn-helix domain-containing protein [Thermoanaerobaculia bacterium]
MTPQAKPTEHGVSPDYLLSDEFVLFIVRFGLRLTASHWGMSERTLRRLFHGLGTTSRAIVRDVRRREALRLLATDQPFPVVAGYLGFSSEKIFSRWVHQHFGETPTALRRSLIFSGGSTR